MIDFKPFSTKGSTFNYLPKYLIIDLKPNLEIPGNVLMGTSSYSFSVTKIGRTKLSLLIFCS
jgi:hypothetical protein